MKFDFNKVLVVDGVSVKNEDQKESTYFDAVKSALLSGIVLNDKKAIVRDGQLLGQESYDRYSLVKKIDVGTKGEVDLSVEEVSLIKDLVGVRFNTLIVGTLWDFLESR